MSKMRWEDGDDSEEFGEEERQSDRDNNTRGRKQTKQKYAMNERKLELATPTTQRPASYSAHKNSMGAVGKRQENTQT